MSTENGKKALKGEWVRVGADQFTIEEDMTMTFQGESCYVVDSKENRVASFDQTSGRVSITVLTGYRCDVMKAHIMFEKLQ